jgi:hypothetical protein
VNVRTASSSFTAIAIVSLIVFNFQNCANPNNISPLDEGSTKIPANAFVFSPVISANIANYNLSDAAAAAGWDKIHPLYATVTINASVVVYSSSVTEPGFYTGVLPAESLVMLANNGTILGGRFQGTGDKSTNQAWEGGTALQIDANFILTNTGQIVGGAGIGGEIDCDSCPGCGGGNGGSNGGAGGSAIVFNADGQIKNTGNISGAGGGGSSGGGAYAAGVCSGAGGNGQGASTTLVDAATPGGSGASLGGDGGSFGQAGASGGNAGNGQAYGGVGGYALVLNGHAVTLNSSSLRANSSYTATTWLTGINGRIAP